MASIVPCSLYHYLLLLLLLLATATMLLLQLQLYAPVFAAQIQVASLGWSKCKCYYYYQERKASMSMGNYLTFLPLIALLLLDLLNPNLGPQLCESNGLGEDVPELSSCLDILELDLSSIDTVTDEMEFGVDVLAPVMEDRVLCQSNGGLVVHHQCRRAGLLLDHLLQQPAQPYSLAARRRRCNVLGFTCAQRDHPLLLRLPGDGATVEEEQNSGRALSTIDVLGHVVVAEPGQLQSCFSPPWVDDAVPNGPCHVAEELLDGGRVVLTRILHESAKVADGEHDVRPSVREVAQPADDAPVLRLVHLLHRALL